MYPIWLVEWAGELLGGDCLAGSRVNSDAPACPTRVQPERVSGTAKLSQWGASLPQRRFQEFLASRPFVWLVMESLQTEPIEHFSGTCLVPNELNATVGLSSGRPL